MGTDRRIACSCTSIERFTVLVMCSYDNYKLNNPHDAGYYSDYVTSCCGAEQVGSGASNCCDSKFLGETDICSECKEHASEWLKCSECEEDDSCYTMIEQYEYDEKQREHYADMKMDEDRL